MLVPPPNVGITHHARIQRFERHSAVSGATTSAALDTYTRETIYTAVQRAKWCGAGPREDSFFADAPGIFDLLDPRILGPDGHGQTGNGVDGFKGYNVLTFAIQIPLANSACADRLQRRLHRPFSRPGSLCLGQPPAHYAAQFLRRQQQLRPVDPGQPARQSAVQRSAGCDSGQGQLQPRCSHRRRYQIRKIRCRRRKWRC